MAALPAESKAPTRNRKEFIRTKVPGVERAASVVCVALLAVIAAAIWWKGGHFDPGRYALRTEALKSTEENVEGKSGTLRATGDGRPVGTKTIPTTIAATGGESTTEGYESGGADVSAANAVAIKREPLEINLAGLKPMSDTEFYTADNLYEKIDGRAPAYLNFNVRQLRSRSFEVTGGAGSFVDVFEFLFDTPVNAFGMFALERDPKGAVLDFAPDGYAGEMGYFFRQGARYIQIIASDQKPQTLALTKAVAQDRAKHLPADDAGLDARRRLPATSLDPASVAFVQENALGQAFLKNVFQATYDFSGAKLPFFVMITSPTDAASAWKSFQDFSGKFGGKMTALPDVNGAKVFQAENSGLWKVVFQREGEVGGIFDASDVDKARQFVEQYLQGKMP